MTSLVEEMESKTSLDAEWKRIQEKTFTRWCNEQLKFREIVLTDLAGGISDGVNLIHLLELLSTKKLGRYNKKPRVYAQKMENVDMALNFITKTERIRLVNIGSGDIVGGNKKLILGLVWTLILHYQINLGLGLDGDKSKNEKMSAKKALLGYINSKIPEKDIKDFTTCWSDGTAIAALVDAIAPGLCPEAEEMDAKDALANAQHAMKLADDWLGVPMVLGPEDMVNPNVDELSMMTYLSQFPDAKLKPGAPIKLRSSPNKVHLSGPGIEGEGLKKGLPAVFYANTKAAGSGNLEAKVDGPEGMADVHIQDNKDGTHTCSYVPPTDGTYNVNVLWGGLPVTKEPVKVYVSPGTNALACRAYGPGVEGTDLKEGVSTEFFVETAGAGEGELSIDIRGPKGPLDSVTIQQDAEDEHQYSVQYVPPTPSQYIIEVKFAGLHIKDSPFKVRAIPDKPDASKCYAEGPGVNDGLQVKEETWFHVYTKGAGRGDLVANARGLHGEVTMSSEEVEPGVTKYTYTPKESGDLVITVKYGGYHIQGSRFRVQVKPPPRPDKCLASGPGLAPKGVRVNFSTNFNVKTKDAGSGSVDVAIHGPEDIDVPYKEQSSYSHAVDYTYMAVQPGQYTVDIKFAGQNIPGSPFPVAITDPSKVDISGPGINGEPILVGVPHTYDVATQGAGPGDIACHVPDSGRLPDVTALDENNFQIVYTPTNVGPKKMNVTFNEAPIPKTPLRLNVYDPSKVSTKGPGLEPGNKTGDTTYFNIDKRKAGEGQLKTYVEGPHDTELLLKDQGNDIVRCEYKPEIEGDYTIFILFEDAHVPGSPFNVFVKEKVNPSLVIAYGEGLNETGLTTDSEAEFTVDYTAAGDGELQVNIEGPGGGVELDEAEIEEGVKRYIYHTDPEENGRYVVQIKFADEDIPGSPFSVDVKWKSDPSRVIAEGSGLEGGTSKELAEFTVDLQKAGDGELEVDIDGPCPVKISSFDSDSKPVDKFFNTNGSFFTFQYFPELPGAYTIPILFNKTHIPGSPFKAIFELGTDPSKCFAHGPGLREHGVRTGDPGNFVIDAKMAGPGAVDAIVEKPGSLPLPPIITSNNDSTYNVLYNPHRVGTYEICVTFADASIPGSPFLINVTDPDKISLQGPGCIGEDCVHHPISSPVLWVADTRKAGPGIFEAKIEKKGENEEEKENEEDLEVTEDGPMYNLEFQPKSPGLHVLKVSYSGNDVDLKPAIEVFDSDNVLVYGPAFDGVDLGEEAQFYIDCSKAGNAQLGMDLYGPANDTLEFVEGEPAGFKLNPSSPGVYEVDVSYGSHAVPGSPFSIPVRDITRVGVDGSGVTGEGAKVGQPATVIVDTSESGPAPLEVRVTSPSGNCETVELEKSSENEDLYKGSYTPKEPGYYGIEVEFNGSPLPESPYQAPIGAPNLVEINWPEHSFVDTNNVAVCNTEKAGPGKVEAVFKGPGSVSWHVTPSSNGTGQNLNYSVTAPGTYEVSVLYNGFPVEEKPRQFQAVNLNSISVSGPGIEPGILAKEETDFDITTAEAGNGSLSVTIESPEGENLPIEVTKTDESESSHKVSYTPTAAGDHNITIMYNEREIGASPICVSVSDPSQVVCTGDGLKKATVNETAAFKADASKAGKGSLQVSIEGPAEAEDIRCQDNQDGTYSVTYVPTKPGVYSVDVKYCDVSVDSSPFTVQCYRPLPDASKCIVTGIENPGEFTVDCRDAGGSGLLEVGVSGSYVPVDFVSVRHNGDYTFRVSYDVSNPGETTISVKWHNQHLTGSPFVVSI